MLAKTRRTITIHPSGAVMTDIGTQLGLILKGPGDMLIFRSGGITIETDTIGAMKFELSVRYSVPEGDIIWTLEGGNAYCR
jgi:hypothetical protein